MNVASRDDPPHFCIHCFRSLFHHLHTSLSFFLLDRDLIVVDHRAGNKVEKQECRDTEPDNMESRNYCRRDLYKVKS